MSAYITFGEIMLRLKSPGKERLLQSPQLEATFGGSEANVAVGLARLGLDAGYVSVIPRNTIGDACLGELQRWGVDTRHVRRQGSRLGLYFLEEGANQRPSVVVYDRAHSAIAEAQPGDINWDDVFHDVRWFHITGITPAISATAATLSLEAMRYAKQKGLTVSLDLNYRAKMWNYGIAASEVMGSLMPHTDIVIGNEEDYQKSLGIKADTNVENAEADLEVYKELTGQALKFYPNIRKVAVTLRKSFSSDYNGWQAVLNNREEYLVSGRYEIHDIVDRIGTGDTFSAGFIFGLTHYGSDKTALEFAVAASCLAHSIPGDFPIISISEVEKLVSGQGSGRVQR